MRYRDFLDSAIEIMEKDELVEVDFRNAASRAYYALFHACKPVAEAMCSPAHGNAHEKVIRALKSHTDHKIRSLGNSLEQARDFRSRADYTLDLNYTRGLAMQTIGHAKKRMQEIESMQRASGGD